MKLLAPLAVLLVFLIIVTALAQQVAPPSEQIEVLSLALRQAQNQRNNLEVQLAACQLAYEKTKVDKEKK